MREIGIGGLLNWPHDLAYREGAPGAVMLEFPLIDFYGHTTRLKFDYETSTPYVTVKEGRRQLNMPLMPGDVIGLPNNQNESEYRVFNGKYEHKKGFKYEPFGIPATAHMAAGSK